PLRCRPPDRLRARGGPGQLRGGRQRAWRARDPHGDRAGDRARAGRPRRAGRLPLGLRGSGRLSDRIPGLLAFALAHDGRGIRTWRRDGERVMTEVVGFTPFLLLADPALVTGA